MKLLCNDYIVKSACYTNNLEFYLIEFFCGLQANSPSCHHCQPHCLRHGQAHQNRHSFRSFSAERSRREVFLPIFPMAIPSGACPPVTIHRQTARLSGRSKNSDGTSGHTARRISTVGAVSFYGPSMHRIPFFRTPRSLHCFSIYPATNPCFSRGRESHQRFQL